MRLYKPIYLTALASLFNANYVFAIDPQSSTKAMPTKIAFDYALIKSELATELEAEIKAEQATVYKALLLDMETNMSVSLSSMTDDTEYVAIEDSYDHTLTAMPGVK